MNNKQNRGQLPKSPAKRPAPEPRLQPLPQPHPQQRQPLPDPTDMFNIPADPQSTSKVETPARLYAPDAATAQREQLMDTMPLKPHTASGQSRKIKVAMVSGTPGKSPKSNGSKKHYRASAEASDERRGKKPTATLVPNFRSISPSIFNIDLNQSATAINNVIPGSSSPQGGAPPVANNNQQIYVSIQSKRNETGHPAAVGSPQNIVGNESNMRIKRVGPLNKGDKIKFGVLVPRDMKRKTGSAAGFIDRNEIFETPKQLQSKAQVAIGKHSDAVNKILDQYRTYTTPKQIPTGLSSRHANLLKQFKTNFRRETGVYEKHRMMSSMSQGAAQPGQSTAVGAGGYFTDSEALKTQAQRLQQGTAKNQTAVKASQKSWFSDDGHFMSIRDVIEEHAKSVAALNKSFRPNIHLEIDEKRRQRNRELEEKGRQIAQDLNLSVHSITTKVNRMYRSLTSEQPLRQHNKPLTQLMRPQDRLNCEKKHRDEEDRKKIQEDERAKLKRKMMHLSMNSLQREFKSGLSSVSQAQMSRPNIKQQKRLIDDFRKKKLSHGAREDWEQQRKEIEESIDNGYTFSHLSRQYPIKREWGKYLVLLKQKEKDRIIKEKKIQELVEDLYEKGVTDDKLITKELDLFEYMEFKKQREKSRARIGAKGDQKVGKLMYSRVVDTERTLKVEKISMDFSDGYDDGPGGFQVEDFAGIETMFSKHSLEQRKMRVDRARERLRQKRQQRIDLAVRQREEEKLQQQHQRPELTIPPMVITADQRNAGPSILEQVSKSRETSDAQAFAQEGSTGYEQSGVDQIIKSLASREPSGDAQQPKQRKKKLVRPHLPKDKVGQSAASQRVDMLPPAILEAQQQESLISGRRVEALKLSGRQDTEPASKKSGPIRVEIASAGGLRNAQKETLKSNSQIRDYSLEDGGIFEKKTGNANLSIEEAKIESITHQSFEMLAGAKSTPDIQEGEAQSQDEGVEITFEAAAESYRQTGETLIRREMDEKGDRETELMDPDEDGMMSDSKDDIQDTYGARQAAASMQAQQRIRPSTTENVRGRIMKNRRRQLMSGVQQLNELRTSAPNGEQVRFGNRKQPLNERSAGVITTVQQRQFQRTMMNQDSSEPNQFQQYHPRKLAETTASNFRTEGRNASHTSPSGIMPHGANETGSPSRPTVTDYFDKRSIAKAESRGTNLQTAADDPSEARITIWKELMRLKEKDGLSGSQHLSRATIRNLRGKVRRERLRSRKRNRKQVRQGNSLELGANGSSGPGSQSYITPTAGSNSSPHVHRAQSLQGLPQDGSMVGVRDLTQQHRLMFEQRMLSQGPSEPQFATQPQSVPHGAFISHGSHNATQEERETTDIDPYNQTMNSQGYHPHEYPQQMQDPLGAATQGIKSGSGVLDQGSFQLGPLPSGNIPPQIAQFSMSESEQAKKMNKNFLEMNRTYVRENSLKKRITSHVSRVRFMKLRRPESHFQSRLTENLTNSALQLNQRRSLGLKLGLRNHPTMLDRLKTSAQVYTRGLYASTQSTTSQMYPAYKHQLQDQRSMKVFKKNELNVDPDLVNKFTRNQAWNETLNCPYYGLMSLRKTQEKPINSLSKEENILVPFTMGNKKDRMNIRKVKSAIKHRNQLREMDSKIYNLIELCHKSSKIEWKKIYDDNQEFRNTQKKKMGDTEHLSYDDLVDLVRI